MLNEKFHNTFLKLTHIHVFIELPYIKKSYYLIQWIHDMIILIEIILLSNKYSSIIINDKPIKICQIQKILNTKYCSININLRLAWQSGVVFRIIVGVGVIVPYMILVLIVFGGYISLACRAPITILNGTGQKSWHKNKTMYGKKTCESTTQ